MDAIEIGVEPDAVGHETHRRPKKCIADNGFLLAKVKEFMVEKICEDFFHALEDSVEAKRTSEHNCSADSAHHYEHLIDANRDPQYMCFLDNIISTNSADCNEDFTDATNPDPQYMCFLDNIISTDSAGRNEDFTDATNPDPQYKCFLDNLREDGGLFFVEYGVSDGVSSTLTYEADDGIHDRSQFNTVENRKGRAVGNGKSVPTSSLLNRSRSKSATEYHTMKKRQIEELRASSTVLVVGTPDARQNKRDVRRRREMSEVKKNSKLKAKSCGDYERKSGSDRLKNPKAPSLESRKNMTVKDEFMEDDMYKVYLTWVEHSNKNPETIAEKVLEVKGGPVTESSCDSDIVAIGDHPFSDEEYSPFVPAKNYDAIDVDGADDRSVGVSNSWFRKELMNILRQPYNQTELFNLYCDVSIRKNKIRERQLRDGREISYITDYPGNSYLDQHPDFRDMFMHLVDATVLEEFSKLPMKDRHRALNLLRGFFFYLKNVVRDGAFKPWLDTECLKTMPLMPKEVTPLRTAN